VARKIGSRDRLGTIDLHYHSESERGAGLVAGYMSSACAELHAAVRGERTEVVALAVGREDRREIPPLRRPTRSRTNEGEKRRPVPVGMTVGSSVGSGSSVVRRCWG